MDLDTSHGAAMALKQMLELTSLNVPYSKRRVPGSSDGQVLSSRVHRL